MKQIIIGLCLIAFSLSAEAQATGTNSKRTSKSEAEKSRKQKKKKAALNHRRIYNWKTGQRATPTGQEATGVGSGYQSGRKDTSGKRDNE